MGLSSKSQTTTSKTSTNQTQMPVVPSWGTQSLQDFNTRINGLGQADPTSYVAGPTANQTAAFTAAGNLGDWKAGNTQASGLASAIANAHAATAGNAAQARVANVPGAVNATSQGYDPAAASSTGYDPTMTGAARIAPTTNDTTRDATSAGVFDRGISGYLNPFVQNVVNSSLSDFDQNAAVTRAQQEAHAAGNNAFAGSRYGLQEAETAGQLARARGSLESGLLSTGYDTATNLANEDAARRQQTGLSNSAASNAASSQNAAADNSRSLSVAQLIQQSLMANQNAANTAGEFGANASNAANLANAQASNQAGAFGANASNAASSQNATAANALNENATNLGTAVNTFNAGQTDNTNQFNATQKNDQLQRSLQAAGVLGTIASDAGNQQRADLGSQLATGGVEQGINQAKATAPISLAQAIGTLLGQNQLPLLTGQHMTGVTQGKSTTTSNPSLMDQIGSGLGMATNLAGLFMGAPTNLAGLFGSAGGANPYAGMQGFLG